MKKVNFLGIELDVVDQDDIDQAAAEGGVHRYVVIRCADSDPRGGSPDLRRRRTRTLCEVCGELCWLDPKSFDPFRGMTLVITCTRCEVIRVRERKAGADG
jgi:hypothetical protein